MDYSQLSDQEINMQVAKIIHPGREVIESKSRPPSACLIGCLPSKWLDYCNNPADAWPIIFNNRMFVDPIGVSDWSVTSDCDRYREISKNPLRAAMCVFLMLKEDEHA